MKTDKIPSVVENAKDIPVGEAVNIWGILDNDRENILYMAMKQIKENFDEIIAGNQVYVKNKIYETDPDIPITETNVLTVEEYTVSRNLRVTYNGLELVPNIEYTKTSSTTVTFDFPITSEDYVLIEECPETYVITTLLLSRRDTRYNIQTDFAIYPFDLSRDLIVLWNGVRLIKDMGFTVLSSSSIRFLFEIEIEDTIWIYIENVY